MRLEAEITITLTRAELLAVQHAISGIGVFLTAREAKQGMQYTYLTLDEFVNELPDVRAMLSSLLWEASEKLETANKAEAATHNLEKGFGT